MALPQVVIVGRPNVGKSSLLNMLARRRISIVDPRAGITRDRVTALVADDGPPGDDAAPAADDASRYFEAVDTGGIGIVDADHLERHVEQQIAYAVDRAAVVLFVVDAREDPNALDRRAADMLRRQNKPVLLVANKIDDGRHACGAAEYHRLGFGEPLPVSALHGRGRGALLERIWQEIGAAGGADGRGGQPPEPVLAVAIVGKRNAGKSTLVNALAGEPRMIVSETPGTTRDAVDVRFERDGCVFVAIDTAGVRKRSSMSDVDFYSHARALRSIRRADVVLHLIDATVPVSEVDLKLARAVLDEYKPLVLGVNKWDLAERRATTGEFAEYLTRAIPFVAAAPVVFLTAQTGRNVDAAIDVAASLHRQARTRVPTARLNEALQAILAQRGPSPPRGTRPLKVYYATQIDVAPPTIVFFCNAPQLVGENYRRYMENQLRGLLPLGEVPLRLLFRARQRDEAPRAAPKRQEAPRAARKRTAAPRAARKRA